MFENYQHVFFDVDQHASLCTANNSHPSRELKEIVFTIYCKIVKQRLPPSSIALFISRCRLVINISYICGRLIILLRLSAVSVTAHTPSGGPTKSCVLLLLW